MKENEKQPIDFNRMAEEIASELRSGKRLTGKEGALTPMLKLILESALEGEMDHHLQESRQEESNRRNGHTRKNLKSSLGGIEIFSPRDRQGSFTPETIAKRQRTLPGDLDEKILHLYGRGMSYSDIRSELEDLYGIEISPGTMSSITDRVIPAIREWQSRPLDRLYPIVYMDAMHFKIRSEGKIQSRAIYTILGITLDGRKEILGLYNGDNESASFWSQVLTDLSMRGVEDIFIACIDNLKGFRQAIEDAFPKTDVQLCVIHQIRNTLKYLSWKDQKQFLRELKEVYKASTKELAEHNLEVMEQQWGKKYPIVFKSWYENWPYLSNYFQYPSAIRKIIYTTNTVEGYHRMVRKVTKSKGAFPADIAALKLVYLATLNFQKKWDSSKLFEWPSIFNQLSIYFEDRIQANDTLN